MKTLQVYFQGWGERWLLATLAHSGRQVLFEYSPESLAKGLELSPFRLALRQAAYGGFPDYQDYLPGLVADALPDGWGRLVMDRLFRKLGRQPASVSPLDRLAFIGDRAMGALTFEPPDPLTLEAQDLDLLSLANEAQIVLADHDTQALAQLALLGGSPHGARPKVLVQYDAANKRVSADPQAEGLPWMVKFQAQGEHKEACAIEALYAVLARECGQDMPPTQYFDLSPKLAGFGIQRFDRADQTRVPTLTLAGMFDDDFRIPSQDYSQLLRATRALTHSEFEVEKAYARCVFNVVFNNRDDHTKNISFLMNERLDWTLAPCYDLTFNLGLGLGC